MLMKKLPIYQVDAFTNKIFGGNPAAVCPLKEWLPDFTMQQLAAENNLSETAFFVKENNQYHIRWFTPEFEIDLCGHATLASAFIIFLELEKSISEIEFNCKSGILKVQKKNHLIELNFPSRPPVDCDIPNELLNGFNIKSTKILKSRDYFLVYDDEKYIHQLVPNYFELNKLTNIAGVIVTAPGRDVDFVSRFFVPNSVIGEDPVTGSSHCNLIPYWSKEFNKTDLIAKQVSAREGILYCTLQEDRVTMAGEAVLYMKGEYFI